MFLTGGFDVFDRRFWILTGGFDGFDSRFWCFDSRFWCFDDFDRWFLFLKDV